MSVFYLDASAWVKRYFEEPGRDRIPRLFHGGERLASSILGYVEVASTMARQRPLRKLDEQKVADLQTELKNDWSDLTGLPLGKESAERAVELARQYRLRAADAVHLATALSLQNALRETHETVVLVASDRELLEAARAAGLKVEDPVQDTTN